MTKDKLASLHNYLSDLNNLKNSSVPEKHKSHPVEFFKFIDNEIRLVRLTIEKDKS